MVPWRTVSWGNFIVISPLMSSCSAAYLRQSILLSAYETPEMRSLYINLKNVAGKIRTIKLYKPIEVPAGLAQVNNHFISHTAISWFLFRISTILIVQVLPMNPIGDFNTSRHRFFLRSLNLRCKAWTPSSLFPPPLTSSECKIISVNKQA